MEMTADDASPAGTNHPTRPARPPKWWEVAVIAATSGALALPGYALWQFATTCGDGLECILNLPIAGAFSVVVMPAMSWLVWKGCRIPRPFLLAVATVAIGHLIAVPVTNGIGDSLANAEGLTSATTLAPLVYALIGVMSGLAAIVLVWKGIWSDGVRVAVVPLIVVLSLAGHGLGERVARQQQQDMWSAVGVTIYLPGISDRVTPTDASVLGENSELIQISYHFRSANGANLEGPILTLLATTDGGCGDAVRAGYFSGPAGSPDSSCRKTADGFVADDPTGTHYVGVTRGDTSLVLRFPKSSFDDAMIADSLRHAPKVSVADLARL